MKGQNVWTFEQRVALWIINRDFDTTTKERALVFNTIFKDHLSHHGLPTGLADTAVRSQFAPSELKKSHWIDVARASRSRAEPVWARVKARVENFLPQVKSGRIVKATPLPAPSSVATATIPAPRSGSRKRSFAQLQTPSEEGESDHAMSTGRPKRQCRVSRKATEGLVPYSPVNALVAPSTPRKPAANSSRSRAPITPHKRSTSAKSPKSRTPKVLQPTSPWHRPDGTIVYLSQQAHATRKKKLVPVTSAAAFPPPPALLFRYWTKDSCGTNSSERFVSGYHMRCNLAIDPPPAPKDVSPNTLELHFSRHKIASPFISTSCFLPWILRLAVQKYKAGDDSGHISVIDPSKLRPRSFYHAYPFHKMTTKGYPYANGQQHYPGTHEFLIWYEVPAPAMVHTFSVADFISSAARDDVARMLQLKVLSQSGNFQADVLPILKRAQTTFTDATTRALAQLIHFLGLDHTSGVKRLSHVIADVTRGLGFEIPALSEEEWESKAAHFAHFMTQSSDVPLSLTELADVHRAFLDGVMWSLGDWAIRKRHAKGDQGGMATMAKRAAKKGLVSPAAIVGRTFGRAGATVVAREEEEMKSMLAQASVLPPRSRGQCAAIEDVRDREEENQDEDVEPEEVEEPGEAERPGEEEEDEEEIITVTPTRAGGAQEMEQIMYEVDDEEGYVEDSDWE